EDGPHPLVFAAQRLRAVVGDIDDAQTGVDQSCAGPLPNALTIRATVAQAVHEPARDLVAIRHPPQPTSNAAHQQAGCGSPAMARESTLTVHPTGGASAALPEPVSRPVTLIIAGPES